MKRLLRSIGECGKNMRRLTRNMIVFPAFRLIWIQTTHDCADGFKIKKRKRGGGRERDGE